MDGILNINKPPGPTSHRIVSDVRRIFGQKKVGHAGTLDPMATGVLLVCLGKGTRVVEYLMGQPKEYRARMVFGQTTDTEDSTGSVTSERDSSHVTREMLEAACAAFVGGIEQIPPMVSALKHQGQPLYKLARQGKEVERAPRKVTIHSIEIASFEHPVESLPEAEMTVRCSSGTYIRTLCADIGESLGCGAHMSMLERKRVGRFSLADSVTLETLQQAEASGRLAEFVMPIDEAVTDMPSVTLHDGDEHRIVHGISVAVSTGVAVGSVVRVLSPEGTLLAIGRMESDGGELAVKPEKVLAAPPDLDGGQ